jgi:Amt family ammonium transporter
MEVSAGSTAWMLVATALVLLMTPGLALFYGGMVRRKNVLSSLMHSFFALALLSMQWVLIGYSLAFGGELGGFVGDLRRVGFAGVGLETKGEIPRTCCWRASRACSRRPPRRSSAAPSPSA